MATKNPWQFYCTMSIRQNLLLHDGCRLSAETAGSTSALLSLPRILPAGNGEELDTATAPSLKQDTSSVCTCLFAILDPELGGEGKRTPLVKKSVFPSTYRNRLWRQVMRKSFGAAKRLCYNYSQQDRKCLWVLIGLWWREGVNILHAQCSSSRTQWLHTRSAFHRMMPPMMGTFKHLSMNCNSLPSWT